MFIVGGIVTKLHCIFLTKIAPRRKFWQAGEKHVRLPTNFIAAKFAGERTCFSPGAIFLGAIAFSYTGPQTWNDLPED